MTATPQLQWRAPHRFTDFPILFHMEAPIWRLDNMSNTIVIRN
ncbi:hypothetical protein BAOM_2056 [Peribacillus asahii]|uniref:Uncharacterized protein n=1 Tax=Peribacillus asahii TaxID=228899 RepID=A0A3Q9RMI0_9BACI|nr:hypothetical protein BAOM_2056 [Peribacillus asahii]